MSAENYLKNLDRARKEFERTRGRKMTDADVAKWQKQIARSQENKKMIARKATASDKQGKPNSDSKPKKALSGSARSVALLRQSKSDPKGAMKKARETSAKKTNTKKSASNSRSSVAGLRKSKGGG